MINHKGDSTILVVEFATMQLYANPASFTVPVLFLLLFCLMQSSTVSTFCHSTLFLSLYMSVGFLIDVLQSPTY